MEVEKCIICDESSDDLTPCCKKCICDSCIEKTITNSNYEDNPTMSFTIVGWKHVYLPFGRMYKFPCESIFDISFPCPHCRKCNQVTRKYNW